MKVATFLFTDIEGSTRLWEESPDAMGAALREHDAQMRRAIEREGGEVFKTVGDAFCAAFPFPQAAVRAAAAAQRGLAEPTDGLVLKVRMALHRGEAEPRDGDYFGPALNRVARLLGAGHGGQILATESVASQLDPQDSQPLGEHRLRDLSGTERIAMIVAPGLPSEFPPLRTLDATPNNLASDLSPLIGREGERRALREALARGRWATLVGAGGVGKTRLATTVAADLLGGASAAEGVWFVDLSSASEGDEIETRVLEAVGVGAGDSAPRALRAWAKERGVLIVLDNCEQVLEGAARAARTLLESGRGVRVLATSREAIGHPGEYVVRLEPFSPPDPGEDPAGNHAVRLFLARAEAAGAQPPSGEDLSAVVEIVRRLEGIPLAIELAAARTRAMSPRDLLPRLDRALRSADGRRATSARQSTLAATIEWSVRLLTPAQSRVLERLASFADGFTLAAAESVGANEAVGVDAWEAGECATALVDRSLAKAETYQGTTRYRIYETVRQFVAERAPGAGDVAFLRWTKEEASCRAADDPLLVGLNPEFHNIRAAYRFDLPEPEAIEALFVLDAEIGPWLVRRLPFADHFSLRQRLLARSGEVSDTLAAIASSFGARVAAQYGDYETAERWGNLAYVAAERAQDPVAIFRALNAMGATMNLCLRFREATETFARLSRFIESQPVGVISPYLAYVAKRNWILALTGLGDYARAWEQMAAVRRVVDSSETGVKASDFAIAEGVLLLEEGSVEAAILRLEEATRFSQKIGKDDDYLWVAIVYLPDAYIELGVREVALRMLTTALQIARDGGYDDHATVAAERLRALGADVTVPKAPEFMNHDLREALLFAQAEGRAARGEPFDDLLEALARKEDQTPYVGFCARRLARLQALAAEPAART